MGQSLATLAQRRREKDGSESDDSDPLHWCDTPITWNHDPSFPSRNALSVSSIELTSCSERPAALCGRNFSVLSTPMNRPPANERMKVLVESMGRVATFS